MRKLPLKLHPSRWLQGSPGRDIAVVLALTLLAIVLSARLDLNESLYAWTRGGERFQIDELPIGTVVLLMGLIWLSWRRHAESRRELRARRLAEERLGEALAENRRLAQEKLRIQEVERKHLARELHDEFGQYVNAIKLDAVSIRESRGRNAAISSDAARSIIRAVDHVHRAVSDMIGRLRPVALDELGLVAAIEHCVDYWRERLPDTTFVLTVSGDFDGLSEALNLTLYRLIQEGLTNIFKHAHAQRVEITLKRMGSDRDAAPLRLSVVDDGCGLAANPSSTRFGLSGMRERVEIAGGTFALASEPGRGLRFEALLPAQVES